MVQFTISCVLLLAIGAYAGTVPDHAGEYKKVVDAVVTGVLQTVQAKIAEAEKHSSQLTAVVLPEVAEKFDQQIDDFRKQFGENLDGVIVSESISTVCKNIGEKIRDDIYNADIGISHCFALNIEEFGSLLNEFHDAAEKIIEELNQLEDKSKHCVDSVKTEAEVQNAIICLMHVSLGAEGIEKDKIPELSQRLTKVAKTITNFPTVLDHCGIVSGLTTLLTKKTEFIQQWNKCSH